jgi:hypothetical protein
MGFAIQLDIVSWALATPIESNDGRQLTGHKPRRSTGGGVDRAVVGSRVVEFLGVKGDIRGD